MKKRTQLAAVMAATGLLFGTVTMAQAEEELPEHPHVMVTGVELGEFGQPVSYRKCHDLAAGKALRLNAHHESVHTGTAGFGNPDVGLSRAGNFVIPLAPLSPYENCADVLAAVGLD